MLILGDRSKRLAVRGLSYGGCLVAVGIGWSGAAHAVAVTHCGHLTGYTCYSLQVAGGSNGEGTVEHENDGATALSTSGDLIFPEYGATRYFASSNLSTGAVRASIITSVGGSTHATMYERFQFDLPDEMQSAVAKVTWKIEGTTFFDNGSSNGMGAYFGIGDSSGAVSLEFKDLYYDDSNPLYQQFISHGSHAFEFQGLLDINEKSIYYFNQQLFLGLNGHGSLDYGNTAFFNIQLPAGASIVSSSGVLLINPLGTAAVPEAASWAMMILGFGIVGASTRRRRAVPARRLVA